MIEFFNIPRRALIDQSITKKLFSEMVVMSSAEKRLLKTQIISISIIGLLQSSNIGLSEHNDGKLSYDQITICKTLVTTKNNINDVATLLQRSIPAPMFIIFSCGDDTCINWCEKTVNQIDKSKRILGTIELTSWFNINTSDTLTSAWLNTLDISKIKCNTIKDLYFGLESKLINLAISRETGRLNQDINKDFCSKIFKQLADNRSKQKNILNSIKVETQFNKKLKLQSLLKELQSQENELVNQLN